MNRIEERLNLLKEKNEKAFITYITAGLPDYDKTKEIIRAEERAGVDVLELGVPFSDPIADGPVIQDASYRALLNGANIDKTFAAVKEIRDEGVKIPIVFMLYMNTVNHFGVEAFLDKCVETGVDGLIIPDLPMEEQEEIKELLADEKRNDLVLIQLVSPVSKQRIPKILDGARGFVYCVSAMGVTGQSGTYHKNIIEYLKDVKEKSAIPVMMGFGITEAKDVAPMKDIIDGCIVGSHFIKLMDAAGYDAQAAYDYCSRFKSELNG